MINTEDLYGYIELFVARDRDTNKETTFITNAPAHARIALCGWAYHRILRLEGTAIFHTGNGTVVYRIDDIDNMGNLMCTKIVDDSVDCIPTGKE